MSSLAKSFQVRHDSTFSQHVLLIDWLSLKGFDIVKKISEIPTDEKSRPLQPVVISHCGELELRKVPPKAAPGEFRQKIIRWENS